MDQIEPKKKVDFFSIFMQYIHWYTVLDPLHLIVPHDAFHQLMPTKEWYNFFLRGKGFVIIEAMTSFKFHRLTPSLFIISVTILLFK
jgi:hypothetical protein